MSVKILNFAKNIATMRRLCLYLFIAVMPMTVLADDLTSGLTIYIPANEERFDWALNYGGNDGLTSREDYNPEAIPTSSFLTYDNCKRGDQCLEVGGGDSNNGTLKVKNNTTSSGTFFMMRIIPAFGTVKISVDYGGKTAATRTISNNPYYYCFKYDVKTDLSITSVVKDMDNYNFYVDDIFLYQRTTDKTAIEKASRIIVYAPSGITNAQIAELKDIVAHNSNLTGIDLNSVKASAKFSLSPANPNCLMFCAADILSNDHNVVLSSSTSTSLTDIINRYSCADLKIEDGSPFDAMYGFTAAKASYNRTFTTGTGTSEYYCSVCLPFALTTLPSGVKAYRFSSCANDILSFDDATTMEAAVPYIISTTVAQPFISLVNVTVPGSTPRIAWKHTTADDKAKLEEERKTLFHGTFTLLSDQRSSDSQAIYGWQGGNVVSVGSGKDDAVSFSPFRAYFTMDKASGTASPSLRVGGSLSGIREVTTAEADKPLPLYTTDGVKAGVMRPSEVAGSDLPAGVYIIGGKKVTVH